MFHFAPATTSRSTFKLAAAAALTLFAAGLAGCSASGHDLHSALAVLRHSDPDAVGSLDATAQPPSLDAYRHPGDAARFTNVSVSRHPFRSSVSKTLSWRALNSKLMNTCLNKSALQNRAR